MTPQRTFFADVELNPLMVMDFSFRTDYTHAADIPYRERK